MSRKICIRFGGAGLTVAGATSALNEANPRLGDPATEADSASLAPYLRDGERFVPSRLVVDSCTDPTGVLTVAYQLRRGPSGGALVNNGVAPTLTIAGGSTSGKAGISAAAAYQKHDLLAITVTGDALVPATTVDARLEGYIIGRGK